VDRDEFDLEIVEYIRKFGSASRFVQKIIDSLDFPFAIIDVNSLEVKVTNEADFFSGMKCCDLFKCEESVCVGEDCPIAKVVREKKALVINNNNSDALLEMHIHPIFDSSGNVVSVIIYRSDITQMQALVESEKKFKEAFQHNTSVMSISTIDDNRFLEVNENFLEVLGYAREEVVGKTSLDINLFKDERVRVYIIDEMRKKGKIRNYELKVLNKKKEVITGLFSAETIKLLGKSHYLTVFEDITERKKADLVLRQKEKMYVKEVEDRFYNILQNSQDLVYRYNFRMESFDYVSESVFTILGYSLGEFMKMKMVDYNKRIHPDDMEKVEYVGDNSEEESVFVVEYRFKKKDGDYVWLKVNRVLFRDDKGNLIYSMGDVRDISARKAAEEEKAKLEERIVHMRDRSSKAKERISLTEREKVVLWGFCRYPLLNDEELANKLDLKRSTLTAIKNRLKKKGWFSLSYVPNFHKLGCQFFSIFDVNFKQGKAKGVDFVKNVSF